MHEVPVSRLTICICVLIQVDSLHILAMPKKIDNFIAVNVQVLKFQSELKLKLNNASTTAILSELNLMIQLTAGLFFVNRLYR